MKNRNGLKIGKGDFHLFNPLQMERKKKPQKTPDYLISTKIYKMEHKKTTNQ